MNAKGSDISMKINEVEKMLEIPKASIRFYEKEGLLTPKRNENRYREYSDEDVERLKKIIVFRKIGLPVEDIKGVLSDELSLQDALVQNIERLELQRREIEGAIKVCELMCQKNESIKTFDQAFYWDVIHTEERKGNRFFEIAGDLAQYEKRVFFDEFGLIDESGKLRYSVWISVLIVLVTCVAGGLLWMFLDAGDKETETSLLHSFIEGFTFPFVSIIICSVFGLPLHYIRKKNERAARILKNIGWWLGVLFILVLTVIILLEG